MTKNLARLAFDELDDMEDNTPVVTTSRRERTDSPRRMDPKRTIASRRRAKNRMRDYIPTLADVGDDI